MYEYLDRRSTSYSVLEPRGTAAQPNNQKRNIMNTVSIIGAGGMAAAIGSLAAKAGYAVEVSSRDATKALALAEKVGAGATTKAFGATPSGDIVILAVPYSVVLDVVAHYGDKLAGKLLVDITNPVAPDLKSLVTPADSYGAREIANSAPANAVVVKAFNTQFSHVLAAGTYQGHPVDVFVAGDVTLEKARVSAFIARLGLRPMDVGPLPMARTLEHFALLSLGILAHSIKHTRFSLGVSLLG